MKYFSLVVLIGAALFGIHAFTAGLCPDHSCGEKVGELRVFGQHGDVWEGALITNTWTMHKRLGDAPEMWEFSVTDESVASRIKETLERSHMLRVRYSEWFIKPYGQKSAFVATGVQEAY